MNRDKTKILLMFSVVMLHFSFQPNRLYPIFLESNVHVIFAVFSFTWELFKILKSEVCRFSVLESGCDCKLRKWHGLTAATSASCDFSISFFSSV